MNHSLRVFLPITMAALFGCASSQGQILAIPSLTYSPTDQQPSTTDATFGWKFSVGASDLSVTSLGLLDVGSSGFVDSHHLGIWDSGNSLVADVSFAPSDPPAFTGGGFAYYQLSSPATLQAGQSYSIGNWSSGSSDQVVQSLSSAAVTYATDYITYNGASYATPGAGFAAPDHNYGVSHGVFGPTFEFTPVPEPEEYAFAGGLALLAFAAYRRFRTVRT
jgi:hypothetical protein